MTAVLALMDQPAWEAMKDHTQFDVLARAITLDADCDYLSAIERFTDAADAVREQRGQGATVRMVLDAAGVNAGEVEAGVRLLERRDSGLLKQLDADIRAVAPSTVPVDPAGRVMLGPDADMGALLVNEEEHVRRWARMCSADPRGRFGGPWDGDKGRQRFKEVDHAWIESRLDLVGTAERAQALAEARARSENLAHQVDSELREAISVQAGVKALDDRLSALAADTLTTRAQRDAAAGAAVEPAGPGVKFLLEAQTTAGISGDFGRERAYLLDLGLDETAVLALEAYALAQPAVTTLDAPARHAATGRFQRAPTQGGRSTAALPSPRRADDELAAQLAAGGTVDAMGKVTTADPAEGRSGLDVPGAGMPLAPHSMVTRAGFDSQVKQQQQRNGQPWPAAAREVAGTLAPAMTSAELAAAGLLTGPAV